MPLTTRFTTVGAQFDLETAASFCRRLEAEWGVDQPDFVLIDALSSAIGVRYMRCFTTGIRAKLPSSLVDALPAPLKALHADIRALRNKHLVHSGVTSSA